MSEEYKRYRDDYGPNVQNILCGATRVINCRIPSQVRKELMRAVKDGVLGRLPKDGRKPEVFYHPDHKFGAMERQKKEAEYLDSVISKVVVTDEEKFKEKAEAMMNEAESHE